MELIDIGANLCHDSFDSDRDAVIARAARAGVAQMVVTGSDAASSRRSLALARQHAGVLFATAGLHPHQACEFGPALLDTLRELTAAGEVVAVGETGLDFFRDLSPRDRQEAAFHAHLELAAETGLPVFLHQRDAHERFLPILDEYLPSLNAAVVHCFTGADRELDAYLERDLHVGITGWICDERRGRHLLDIAGRIPAQRLMVETDAPYLLPRDLSPKPRTRRNEPAYLAHIAATLARARGETTAALASATTATARRFFALPARAPQPGNDAGGV